MNRPEQDQRSCARITMMRDLLARLGWFLGISLLVIRSVQAQSLPASYVVLSPPSMQDFPLLQPTLKVFSANGNFVHGLSIADIQLYENGLAIPLQDVQEHRVGVQAVFVINPAEIFLAQSVQGNTRYDDLMNGLVDWARRRLGSTVDDLSIVVSSGPSRSHLSNPLELFYTLASYRVPRDATPSLDALLKGIEIAADPTPRRGMERVVFFITAPLSEEQSLGIENAVQQAQQNGVRIYVWVLTAGTTPNPAALDALKSLAEQTQGAIWLLSKPEDQPDPETILEPLRSVYVLRYLASAGGGNERRLEVAVTIGEENVRSQAIPFRIDLQPPNVAFLSPPGEILRQPQKAAANDGADHQPLQPQVWRLNLLIEFPDGRPRAIRKLRVVVDGQVILERDHPPFDSLVWDLSDYTQSSQHVLQAEVVDELGMSATTLATPIFVRVSRPSPSPSRLLGRNIPLIVLSLTFFAASSLILIMAMRGQLLPTSLRLSRRLGIKRKQPIDPLTQPVPIPPLEPAKKSASLPRAWQPTSEAGSKVEVQALLYRLGNPAEQEPGGIYAMVSDEMTLGSNATRNLLVIDDPSVEAVHARLVRQADGRIRLYDLGSLMGTWVNYTPVSGEGVTLEDGDVIHIGRVGFRFRLRATKRPESLVQPRNESQ